MKTADPALIAYLQSAREVTIAEIYTITLISGTVLHYTSFDVDVLWEGDLYTSGEVLITRKGITQKTGTEVAELELTMVPRGALIDGVPWLEAVNNGALDGATISLQRLFVTPQVTYGVSVG